MGNIALPGNTDTKAAFQEEALFENTVAHHLGDHPLQGTIHILRKHLYSTKLNLTTVFSQCKFSLLGKELKFSVLSGAN